MIDTLMTHAISSSTKNNAAKFSHNSIQGHHHGVFEVSYFADMNMIRWSMTVGCLIDQHSPAARYARGQVLKRAILGCGVLRSERTGNFLVISDLHMPYEHRDSFDFLWEVKKQYRCTNVINVGDVFDNHAGSFHESEPDALSPEDEYEIAKEKGQLLQDMFPKMVITPGNHCRIPQRKAKAVGLPTSMLSDFNKLYGLKNSWEWIDPEYKFDSGKAEPVLIPMTLNRKGRWDKTIRSK